MTKNNKSNRQHVIIATAVASLLMLTFGLAYHALALRLGAYMTTSPIVPESIQRLPMQIGSWTGQDVPLDEAIVRATGTDAHINRIYSRYNDREYVSFYVAYGVNARDLMVHRPEICYVGAGLTLMNRRFMELPLSDGMKLPCSVLDFSRGVLNTNQVTVLYYFIVDGQYCRDVSLLRSRAWRGSGTVRYVTQVQIAASNTINLLNADSAAKLVCEFAAESASSISRLFESVEEDQCSDNVGFDDNNMFSRGTGSD